MTAFDLPLEQLRTYLPTPTAEPDFDEFWDGQVADARTHGEALLSLERVDNGLTLIDTWDLTFAGHDGSPIRAWYTRPAGTDDEPLPTVVQYLGYGGGRSEPHERITWSAAGYAHILMDTRGQGGTSAPGATADPAGTGSSTPGFLTRGVQSPHTHYYTRLIIDAVRAVDVARELPGVTNDRIIVAGNSQGGGLAISVAGLLGDAVWACVPTVPFMGHWRRGVDLTDKLPLGEITTFLSVHRDAVEQTFRTLSYVDTMNLGRRATAPTLFSVGLRDDVVPPSTVFAAFNHYGTLAHGGAPEKAIEVYEFNNHEGGGAAHHTRQLAWLRERLAG